MKLFLIKMENFDFGDTRNILLCAVLAVTAVSFLIQLYYYLFVFRKVGLKRRRNFPRQSREPVSVIICIKDESANLSKILPLVLEQNYPEYEVIAVNDNSSDNSGEILQLAQTRYPHLQIRNLVANSSVHGRSVVLGVGIKAAKYDRLAIIDVACRPSANWLKSLASGFDSDIVISYTRYTGANRFVRAANFCESLFRLGYALNRKPYTASGENESFVKKLFFEKGFNPLLRKLERVEPVFFNSIMNKKNTAVILSPEAVVESERSLSFRDWCMECSGDLFSRRLFRKGTRHVRLPEIISKALFYPGSVAAIILTANTVWMWIPVAGTVLLHLTVRIFVFRSAQKILGERKLLFHAVLRDFYCIVEYLYILMLVKHRKTIRRQ